MMKGTEASPRDGAVTLTVDYQDIAELVADLEEAIVTGRTIFATTRPHAASTRMHVTLNAPGVRQPISLHGSVASEGVVSDGGIVVDTVYDSGVDSLIEGDTRLDAPVPGIVIEIDRASMQALTALTLPVVRLLLVEDNQHVADLLRGGLRRGTGDLAYVIHAAPDGRAALSLLHDDPWDVAIVDMYLPVVDGAELIRRARADPALRDRPIIAVSAGGQAARKAAIEAGADAFLEKPVRLRQVVETVRQHCAR
jgi:CheY-like chemotaxis protein